MGGFSYKRVFLQSVPGFPEGSMSEFRVVYGSRVLCVRASCRFSCGMCLEVLNPSYEIQA